MTKFSILILIFLLPLSCVATELNQKKLDKEKLEFARNFLDNFDNLDSMFFEKEYSFEISDTIKYFFSESGLDSNRIGKERYDVILECIEKLQSGNPRTENQLPYTVFIIDDTTYEGWASELAVSQREDRVIKFLYEIGFLWLESGDPVRFVLTDISFTVPNRWGGGFNLKYIYEDIFPEEEKW